MLKINSKSNPFSYVSVNKKFLIGDEGLGLEMFNPINKRIASFVRETTRR